MLDRLDPQAQALLEQLAASTAEESQPDQPFSSAEHIAAARTGFHLVVVTPEPRTRSCLS